MSIARITATLFATACVCLIQTELLAGWTRSNSASTPGKMTLIYCPCSGEMALDTGGRLFTTYELVALNGTAFNVEQAKANGWFDGFPNIVTPAKLFKLDAVGAGNQSMGLQRGFGLTYDEVAANLAASGSWKDAPREMDHYLYWLPEPSTITLLAVGMACLYGLRRISAGTR